MTALNFLFLARSIIKLLARRRSWQLRLIVLSNEFIYFSPNKMPKNRNENVMLPAFQPSVRDVVIFRTIRQLRMLQFPGKWQYD